MVSKRGCIELVASCGATLSGLYWCPHDAQGTVAPYNCACDCRKPAPGMLLRAAREHGLALERSWFIGDILDDVEAGRRAGCRTVLIDNGNETVWRRGALREPHVVAADMYRAALVDSRIDGESRGGKMNGKSIPLTLEAHARAPASRLAARGAATSNASFASGSTTWATC